MGVPNRSLPALAYYFGVDEWVFSNKGINEKEFQKLILNPEKNGIIKPVFSFQSRRQQYRGLLATDFFDIETNKVLIRAFVWGVEGQTISQFGLTWQDYHKLKTFERTSFPEPPTLRLITPKSTKITDRIMGEMIVDYIKPQTYYFSIHTPKNCELFVFEIDQYTV
jgi:hypothetical protein